MKNERSKILLLLTAPLWVLLPVLLMAKYREYHQEHYTDTVSVNIGESTSVDVGNRAALQELSYLLQQWPHASFYEVGWAVHGDDLKSYIQYEPQLKKATIHVDSNISYHFVWCGVTKDNIATVARRGAPGDFKALGANICG